MNIWVYCNRFYVERIKVFRAQRTYATPEKPRGKPTVLIINVFNNVIIKINVFNNVIIINYFSIFLIFTHSNVIRKETTLKKLSSFFLRLFSSFMVGYFTTENALTIYQKHSPFIVQLIGYNFGNREIYKTLQCYGHFFFLKSDLIKVFKLGSWDNHSYILLPFSVSSQVITRPQPNFVGSITVSFLGDCLMIKALAVWRCGCICRTVMNRQK